MTVILHIIGFTLFCIGLIIFGIIQNKVTRSWIGTFTIIASFYFFGRGALEATKIQSYKLHASLLEFIGAVFLLISSLAFRKFIVDLMKEVRRD